MKIKLSILAMLYITVTSAQDKKFTYKNFENEVLKYEPKQRKNVSDSYFKKGIIKLNDVKLSVKNDESNFNDADYWNITMAFLNLEEPKSHIEIAFKKATNLQNNNICIYIDAMGPSGLDQIIPSLFHDFYNKCKSKNTVKPQLDLRSYSSKKDLDLKLVTLINKIKEADFYYRKDEGRYYDDPKKLAKQTKLDRENQKIIDSLYNVHRTYIGKSLVGEKFANAMWNVIQHSNVEMMGKYLPVVKNAYSKKQIDAASLKMLIDRYYGLKYGYQIFGSQSGFGFKMANSQKRNEIIKKYGLD